MVFDQNRWFLYVETTQNGFRLLENIQIQVLTDFVFFKEATNWYIFCVVEHIKIRVQPRNDAAQRPIQNQESYQSDMQFLFSDNR